jgi:hypothetical protein
MRDLPRCLKRIFPGCLAYRIRARVRAVHVYARAQAYKLECPYTRVIPLDSDSLASARVNFPRTLRSHLRYAR